MFRTQYDNDLKLWSGLNMPPLYNPKISVAQVLLRALDKNGPKIAQISDDNGIQLSFDDIRLKTIRAAQNLQQRGYVPKQVIGILAKNTHHLAPIVFASLCMGCPIDIIGVAEKAELIDNLKSMEPSLVFCDVDVYDLLEECLTEMGMKVKIFTFGGCKRNSEEVENLFTETGQEYYYIPAEVDGVNDAAAYLPTSGSTDVAKVVSLSHAALCDQMIQYNIMNGSDVVLAPSSISWISGIIHLLTATLNGATIIITTKTFTPELQLRLIEQYRVTYFMNIPMQVNLMLKSDRLSTTDLSSVRVLLIGGNKVSIDLKTKMNSKLPNGAVYVIYGLTEMAGAITIDYPKSNENDSIGQLAVGIKAKIIDDDGNRCGVNVDGEICFKTAYKFLGYYKDETTTAELFDEEGFILTGDIGHFDEDGCLYIVDRKKNYIVYFGSKISTSALENYLIELPDIKSVCVIGIDQIKYSLLVALIIREENANITEADITEMIAAHFPDHYQLRGGVYFVDSIPKTRNGKVAFGKARELAAKLRMESTRNGNVAFGE